MNDLFSAQILSASARRSLLELSSYHCKLILRAFCALYHTALGRFPVSINEKLPIPPNAVWSWCYHHRYEKFSEWCRPTNVRYFQDFDSFVNFGQRVFFFSRRTPWFLTPIFDEHYTREIFFSTLQHCTLVFFFFSPELTIPFVFPNILIPLCRLDFTPGGTVKLLAETGTESLQTDRTREHIAEKSIHGTKTLCYRQLPALGSQKIRLIGQQNWKNLPDWTTSKECLRKFHNEVNHFVKIL